MVHGGAKFSGSILITPEVIAKIKECIPLGPLHNPSNVRGIEVAQRAVPELPQVAVFDTAFHQTMPPRAYLYAVPYEWFLEHEVRRYGFHGTSHRYVSQLAVKQLGLDPEDHAIVTAHLGNGCSLAAVRNGQSMDTTMGLTPLEGVVMDTRSGNIDPSIIAHMKKQLQCSTEEVMEKLNSSSGLLGISGISKDMLTLEQAAQAGNERARLAIEKFCYSVSKAAAGMFVSLGRVDALVFTGGIGENQAQVRAQIIQLLASQASRSTRPRTRSTGAARRPDHAQHEPDGGRHPDERGVHDRHGHRRDRRARRLHRGALGLRRSRSRRPLVACRSLISVSPAGARPGGGRLPGPAVGGGEARLGRTAGAIVPAEGTDERPAPQGREEGRGSEAAARPARAHRRPAHRAGARTQKGVFEEDEKRESEHERH